MQMSRVQFLLMLRLISGGPHAKMATLLRFAERLKETVFFMEKTPAYIRVYNTLRSRILEGDYAIGDLLPAEPELEKQFLVSRTTVRRAVELLSRDGLVEAKQGRGTTV